MIDKGDKPLFATKEGGYDYAMMGYSLVAYGVGMSILLLLNENFRLSIMAGLNIGIV